MSTEGKLKRCLVFVLRYVPNIVRDEFLNIGIFLYSPGDKYLACLVSDDHRRIERFHPQADLELLRSLQKTFKEQIEENSDDLDQYLQTLFDSFSNLFQLSEPQVCLLEDPQREIRKIFERYVGRPPAAADQA